MSVTKYVENWLARAHEDLAAGWLLLDKSDSANLACFHAQQAAEKYLKGFLAHREIHVRKIHDLEALLKECENLDSLFNTLHEAALFLSQFYTESRYPDDYIDFSRQDAEKALKAAEEIEEFILKKIKKAN